MTPTRNHVIHVDKIEGKKRRS